MHRLPLSDELPYQFIPPKLSRFWIWASRPYRQRMLRRDHQVISTEVAGEEHLRPLLGTGDAVLICPNHCGRADGLVLLDLADRLVRPFCVMAAYQIFEGHTGLRRWIFPRLGIFPVDREGSDLSAVKAAAEILTRAEFPLVIFPEGEVYHLADSVTPLREGVAFLATRAAKTLADAGKTAWIVPVGLKYRFPDGHDPMPAMLALMERLETRIRWWPRTELPILERVYRYAEAALLLKEFEYQGACRPGPLPPRIAALRAEVLDRVAADHGKADFRGTDAERIKELRRVCLDRLTSRAPSPAEKAKLRRDLNDLFFAVQTLSYPGDYVRSQPTLDRLAETLMKLDEDVLGTEMAPPLGPRRALLRIGPPIDVRMAISQAKRSREATTAITNELERRIQAELDAIGPGCPIPSLQLGWESLQRAASSLPPASAR